MADILFVHNTFPGRFEFIARPLLERGHRLAAIAGHGQAGFAGLEFRRYSVAKSSTPGIYPLATRPEADVLRGRAAAEQAVRLRESGFDPQLIIGHPGWGETLFMREVFPRARQVLQGEFYYRARGADMGFDPEFDRPSLDTDCRVHAKNMGATLAMMDADAVVCPTPFQASLHPAALQPLMRIIHEGVDVERAKPRPDAKLQMSDGRVLDRSTPVITFVNRRFEPMRGFHIMMRALPAFLRAVPEAQVLMIGADERGGYGPAAPEGRTWGLVFTEEQGEAIDRSRVHFVGPLGYDVMATALSIGRAHVHFTYPFVLSWSLIDAMACEALILGSDTAPVRDAIEDGVNGRLLDFFDPEGLARAMVEAVEEPERFEPMRAAARATVLERYDQKTHCLPEWLALIDETLAKGPRVRGW